MALCIKVRHSPLLYSGLARAETDLDLAIAALLIVAHGDTLVVAASASFAVAILERFQVLFAGRRSKHSLVSQLHVSIATTMCMHPSTGFCVAR